MEEEHISDEFDTYEMRARANVQLMLDRQASAILAALDVILRSGRTIDFVGFDEHGVAVIRSGSKTWRGSSVRDALAQFAEACR